MPLKLRPREQCRWDAAALGEVMLRLDPGEVMLAAAHNRDLDAAQRAGLGTAFIPRPTEFGPGQTKDLAAEGDWDLVCSSIIDLAERFS